MLVRFVLLPVSQERSRGGGGARPQEAPVVIATWPLVALAGLGAFFGLNPAMGWLFAVALGLPRGSTRGT